MRIISGKYKGIGLNGPEGSDTRPTSDRVKEALFNTLMMDLDGSKFLDLFAGTGSIGIEALSRNADEVTFVDFDRKALNILRANIQKIDEDESKFEIFQNNAFQALEHFSERGKIFDLIFLDPPYKMDDTIELIEKIYDEEIIEKYGKIIVEHAKKNEMPKNIRDAVQLSQKKYGNTMLTIYGTEEV